jgi:hypothetical protein
MTATRLAAALAASAALLAGLPAAAASTTVRGTIVRTEGHESPACRTVVLKKADGALLPFRMPANSVENGIMSITLTALATRLEVEITYDPALTSGCGVDPRIQYISLFSGN